MYPSTQSVKSLNSVEILAQLRRFHMMAKSLAYDQSNLTDHESADSDDDSSIPELI
jgi:hypothetical protein